MNDLIYPSICQEDDPDYDPDISDIEDRKYSEPPPSEESEEDEGCED